MQSHSASRQPFVRREEGIALIVTLMILMLVSVLMVGFVASIVADTRASGLDRDQTQAYAASHAGLEQITSELSDLFNRDPSPTGVQVAALRTAWPDLQGYEFIDAAAGGGAGSGYMVRPRFPATVAEPALGIAIGDPLPEDRVNGSMITAGPYQGFRGIITPYDITVTARACPGGLPCDAARGGAEVRMRRTLQTVSIPVFQFGMFSETDLAFHAGAEDFIFQGRVHTNGNLYLAAASSGTLTIGDRITSAREIIRTNLPNGLLTSSGYTGNVRVPTVIANLPANNQYRNLKVTEGSVLGNVGTAINPSWRGLSTGTYLNNIRNWETGAKRLDLPLVADLDGDKQPDALPIDLIRRPAPGELSTSIVYPQRYFALASLRIILSDTEDEITDLPTVLQTVPGAIELRTGRDYAGALPPATRPALAAGPEVLTAAAAAATAPANVYKTWNGLLTGGSPLLGGFIKIEMRRNDNNAWQDVTQEILALGIAGRNLADTGASAATRWNTVGTGNSLCPEPNPNAIIRLQRVRDVPTLMAPCGVTPTNATNTTALTAVSGVGIDYWPNTLYDPREGHVRDDLDDDEPDIVLGGVIHYIELDVNNLRRWLLPAGAAGKIPGVGELAKNENGYIVYFSDRRNNKDDSVPAIETGEYGWEETVNLGNQDGTVYGVLDAGEDVNGDGIRQVYGGTAKASALGPNATAPLNTVLATDGRATTVLLGSQTSKLIARANKAILFRRALKLVNGGITTTSNTVYTCSDDMTAPCNNIIAPGLTIASENPVYIQGNFNATSASVIAEPNVATAIVADSVTVLSNRWNDIRSFNSPTNAKDDDGNSAADTNNYRLADTTGYRVAIVTGKTLPFPKPSYADASFGSDGGVHNFLRSLEDWNTSNVVQRYRGSMVSFFISRQGTGSFKCCSSDVYIRGDRDWQFDTDFLLPARLPPGTPMFRDVNTLTFRQLLRPTQ